MDKLQDFGGFKVKSTAVCTTDPPLPIINAKRKGRATLSSTGWVQFHRKLTDNWLWSDKPFSKGQAWVDLVLQANHSHGRFLKNGQTVVVERGQSARSEVTLAADWGWSRGRVRRFVKLLESHHMIALQTTHLTTVISVLNYGIYNTSSGEAVQQSVQQSVQPTNTKQYINNNDKNDKNKTKTIMSKQTEEIYQTFCTSFSRNPKLYKLTPTRTAKIATRLQDAGYDMLVRAIVNTSKSAFHRGSNSSGWTADLDFIIRSYEQVEKLANGATSSSTKAADVLAQEERKARFAKVEAEQLAENRRNG